ncbi:MAG: T9SS type A sorting domain-containing protein [Prolixibacteraceae bacterium]|nr:T9SS type A sorting domain-containing protein [Prolixibacteraceae bacterium]
MKKITNLVFTIIVFTLILIILQNQKSNGQVCLLDSIGNKKIVYNEFNKPILIQYRDDHYFNTKQVTVYNRINYNDENNISSVSSYIVDLSGDTIVKPQINRRFEFVNNKLSKIIDVYANYDDIVWENDRIIEYKYYYWLNDVIDSSQTRILKYTYANDNVDNVVYKELTGYLFSDLYYSYDSFINPYYKSDLAIIEGYLTLYSCKNNWIKHEGTGNFSIDVTRTISYNKYNYPTKIISDYIDGRKSTQTFSYIITNSIVNQSSSDKILIYPNPACDYISIDNKTNERINNAYIIDLHGRIVRQFLNPDKISVEGIENGIHFIKIVLEKETIVRKVLIKSS